MRQEKRYTRIRALTSTDARPRTDEQPSFTGWDYKHKLLEGWKLEHAGHQKLSSSRDEEKEKDQEHKAKQVHDGWGSSKVHDKGSARATLKGHHDKTVGDGLAADDAQNKENSLEKSWDQKLLTGWLHRKRKTRSSSGADHSAQRTAIHVGHTVSAGTGGAGASKISASDAGISAGVKAFAKSARSNVHAGAKTVEGRSGERGRKTAAGDAQKLSAIQRLKARKLVFDIERMLKDAWGMQGKPGQEHTNGGKEGVMGNTVETIEVSVSVETIKIVVCLW